MRARRSDSDGSAEGGSIKFFCRIRAARDSEITSNPSSNEYSSDFSGKPIASSRLYKACNYVEIESYTCESYIRIRSTSSMRIISFSALKYSCERFMIHVTCPRL